MFIKGLIRRNMDNSVRTENEIDCLAAYFVGKKIIPIFFIPINKQQKCYSWSEQVNIRQRSQMSSSKDAELAVDAGT